MLSNNFYLHLGPARDYILFAGHASPVENEYEYGETLLEYAEKLGVTELISVGARWSQPVLSPIEAPKVLGYSSDQTGVDRLRDAGALPLKSEAAFYFANMIVPLSRLHGIRGYKLSVDHGEPIPHPKSLISILDVLSKLIGLQVDKTDLYSQSKDLAEAIQKSEIEGLDIDEDSDITGSRRPPQGDDIYR